MAGENDVSNAEILAELRALRGVVDDLLTEFAPVLAVFRPSNGQAPGYIEMAGAARAIRRRRKEGGHGSG